MSLIHWLQKSAGMLKHFWPDKQAVPKENYKTK